ncbi:MAG: adenylate kinase [Clostridia bacterium]|nr:adenylate kinase [Clostridia bacterium]
MKKVCVIGCPGSGKSTFSRALCEITGLPLCHLDLLYHNPDRTTVGKPIFRERLAKVLAEDQWVIDGNYGSTMELRIAACDTVFFLDYSVEVCLDGITSRRGKERADMPWVETEDDSEFMAFIRAFPTESRPSVLALLRKYADKTITVFRSREEADGYLQELRNNADLPSVGS